MLPCCLTFTLPVCCSVDGVLGSQTDFSIDGEIHHCWTKHERENWAPMHPWLSASSLQMPCDQPLLLLPPNLRQHDGHYLLELWAKTNSSLRWSYQLCYCISETSNYTPYSRNKGRDIEKVTRIWPLAPHVCSWILACTKHVYIPACTHIKKNLWLAKMA